MRNFQEQINVALCYQKLSWPFTVWINCSSENVKFWAFSLEFLKFFLITRTILVTKYHFSRFEGTRGERNQIFRTPVHFWSTSTWIWNRAKERLRDCSMWNIPLLQVACYQRHYWAYFYDCSEEIWKLPGRHLSRNSRSCTVTNRSVESWHSKSWPEL